MPFAGAARRNSDVPIEHGGKRPESYGLTSNLP